MIRIKRLDEMAGSNPVEMKSYDEDDAVNIEFVVGNETIGGAIVTEQYIDGLTEEYQDSVDDFDESAFRRFDHNGKICNLEDFWVERKFRGKGYSRFCLERLMEKYGDKQMALRAFPDGGVDERTLVRLYSDYGFRVLQETSSDGTIMGKFI